MQGQRSMGWRTVGAVALLAAAAAWWAFDSDAVKATATTHVTPMRTPAAPLAVEPQRLNSAVATTSSAAGFDPLLTPDLIRIFEQMLGNAKASDKAGLMAELRGMLGDHLPAEWQARGLGLLERYIDYRTAMQALPPPDPRDPASMRAALDARADARSRYFAAEERDGLFGAEQKYDRFMLAKREIEQSEGLDAQQRHDAIARAADAWLTPEQRADRIAPVAHLAAGAQTAAFDARGASPQERFAQRSQDFGPAAAQRLAELDNREQDWQARLARYAAADAGAQPQLRDQLFTPDEAVRLPGALALRAAQPAAR